MNSLFHNLFIVLIFTNAISISNCQISNVNFDLSPKEQICLSEYLQEKTFAIIDVKTNLKELHIELKNPAQQITIIKMIKKEVYHHDFTADISGYYEICFKSLHDSQKYLVHLILKYGVGAKDYSSLARTKDLKPIDLELQKMIDLHPTLNRNIRLSQRYDRMFDHILKKISKRIVMYSIIIIVVMLIVGVLEIIYLKKYMERRKII